jgi:NAD(P)-dependent dehydrogenase (short-subunit alcohol dehydrogenase family)
MRLNSKHAIVTGGGSGLGAEICRLYAAEGAAVTVADRDVDNAKQVAQEIEQAGGRALAVAVDVADEGQVSSMMESARSAFGPVNVLVGSAGIGIQKRFLETTLEEWQTIIAVNLTGIFLCGREAARDMVANGGGRIINIASVAGLMGVSGRCAYGASKGGVITLTKVMASELGDDNIMVNAIAPGPVESALTQRMHTEETRAAYHNAMPLGRYGTAREIAEMALFLASDAASFVTGQTIAVDGGMSASGPRFKV